ncbi:MAG: ECF transporter S component [Oscillospiraceae bacterium]|nr:ECF transporter S component [Oscillospiraceae bacterium]
MNKTSNNFVAKNLTAAAICLTLCMILPLFTGQIPYVGMALAPMHIPVLLCGFITGPAYAMIVGLIAPLLRMMIFGMPMPFMAITMSFELATYGLVAGLLYKTFSRKVVFIYISLIIAMLIGRIVWGLAAWQLVKAAIFPALPMGWETFGWTEFFTAAFASAVTGIVLHIVLIPVLVMALRKARIIE